ncbi:MAG: restriction endonuclease subunit S [Desulfobacteraceae bacterium]|nr:restriction endonuclease subunit S [Desulfobacteraceae bacterium]
MKSFQIKNLIQKQVSGEWGKEVVDGEGVKVIRTANFLATGKINFENIVHRSINQRKIEQKKLIDGDILIEKSGGSPTQPVGRVVYFENPDGDTYLCNNFSSILRPNAEIVFPKYLFYSLLFNHKIGKTLRFQNKTTGIINLRLDSYLESKIPLPSISDQTRIATLLSKVEFLIARRKKSIADLDALLKSTFLEMFGDPVRNEKKWIEEPLDKLGTIERGVSKHRPRNAPELLGGKYPLIQTGDVANSGTFIQDYHQTYSELGLKQSKLWPKGTLCITIAANIAKTGILTFNACFPDSVVGFQTGNKSNVYYIHFLFAFLQDILEKKAPHAAQKNINLRILKTLKVPRPPINLQNRFAAIVEKVETLKDKNQDSLKDLETLYGALSQKAFKGELDLSRIPLAVDLKPKDIITAKPYVGEPTLTVQDQPVKASESREQVLHQLFKAFISGAKNKSIPLDDFWLEAEERFLDLMDEDAQLLGVADYDRVRDLLFEMLASGKVAQVFNEQENRMEIREVS